MPECPFGTTWFNAPGDDVPQHPKKLCPCKGTGEMEQTHIDEIKNAYIEEDD